MVLTSSSFFSIIVNGSPSIPFSPSYRIHQGGPLSPFFFIIMAKGLGRYLNAAFKDASIQGLLLHGLNPSSSHTHFLDGTMLVGTPMSQEALEISQMLDDFSEVSTTSINKEKFNIFFINTLLTIQDHVARILGFSRIYLPSEYLGIPLINNSLKKTSWEDLLTTLEKILSSWTFRSLNMEGVLSF